MSHKPMGPKGIAGGRIAGTRIAGARNARKRESARLNNGSERFAVSTQTGTVLILLTCLLAAPSQAATLREVTTLEGPRVYLRDLFEDSGLHANRLLGTGPGPGGRIIVEARQLRAIARQYDVDWEPVSSGDRAILEWPGRPMSRDDAMRAVRTALIAQGAAADCDVDIPGFNPPVVPISATVRPVVSQLDYDRSAGRFTAFLTVSGDGMDPVSVRIGGQVTDVIELPVPITQLRAGAIPGPADLRMARIHVGLVQAEVARTAPMVIGMQLKRQRAAGVPIPIADLMRPVQVNRGETVRLELQAPGLSVTGQGMALDSGAAGERVRVRNMSSQAVIDAEVTGPGSVRVVPVGLQVGLAGRRG